MLGVALTCALVVVPGATAAPRWTSGAPSGIAFEATPRGLVADPAVAGRVFLYANGALFVTSDRGLRWVRRTLPAGAARVQAFAGPPTLLIATTDRGALWRSADLGRTWTSVGCCALAVDPADPAHVLGRDDAGLTRSTDGGATFTRVATPPSPPLEQFAFAFAGGGVLYGTTATNAAYRSVDFGASWQVVTGVPEGELTAIRNLAGRLWVGGLRSTDGAASWQPSGPDAGCATRVSPAPVDPLDLWAVACDVLFRSADGGDHWAAVDGMAGFDWRFVPPPVPLADGSAAMVLDDGPWLIEPGQPPSYRAGGLPAVGDLFLQTDARSPGVAYAGFFRTSDGGRTWAPWNRNARRGLVRVGRRLLLVGDTVESRPADGAGPCITLLADGAGVVADPGGHRAWLLNQRGIWTTGDGVHLHQVAGDPLPGPLITDEVDEFGGAAIAGGRARTLVIELELLGPDLAISRDGGRSFRIVTTDFEIGDFAVDAIDGRLFLASDQFGLRISRDRGAHFSRSVRGVLSVAVDPARRGAWYVATKRRIYRTLDAGRTWQPVARPPGGAINVIAVGGGRLWAQTTRRISSRALAEIGR